MKCKICACEFVPDARYHYISRDAGPTGLASSFGSHDEPTLYDSFDCPDCGCQIIVGERKRFYIPVNDETEETEETENENDE